MKMFVAPALSVATDVCSAAISVRRMRAAAEWRTGIFNLTSTLEMMCASRSVQVPLLTRGNKKPLKNDAGLYSPFFSAL